MKKAGIALLVIGLLLIIFTGFKYFTREKVVDVGSFKVTASRPHHVNWSPYLGIGIMIGGGVILLVNKKK